MKKPYAFVFAICILFAMQYQVPAFASAAATPPHTNASGAALFDLNSGQFLLEKNSNGIFFPASTTKVMTALLTLEKCKLTDVVTVGAKPPYEDGSKVFLIKGEQLTVKQLLYAMLLESANDAALTLAEHISGSKEAFAALMTQRAIELNCTHTHFANPNGLDDKNHYTSARDMALISAKAMENPVFRSIVSTVSYSIPPTNKQSKTRHLHNHNKMLYIKSYQYPGANGIKTGYTIKCKHTYVGSATKNGRTLITVFLHDDKTFYKESKAYFDYGFKNFYDKKVFSSTDIVGSFLPKNSNMKIQVRPQKDVFITLVTGDKGIVKREMEYNMELTSFKQGDVVGTMALRYGGNLQKTINLVAAANYVPAKTILKGNLGKSVHKVFRLSNIKYVLLLLLIAFLSRGFYRKYQRKRGFRL